MLNKKIACSILVVAVAASMWACSSDDDSSPTTPSAGAGSGGSAGAGKTIGAAGEAGSSSDAGSGGTSTAGSSGSSGSTAGSSGSSGSSGSGDTAGSSGNGGSSGGTAGSSGNGGTGGTLTTMGGAAGLASSAGMGGAAEVESVADACAKTCTDKAGITCSTDETESDCVSECMTAATDPSGVPAEFQAVIRCEAQNLSTANYVCDDQGGGPQIISPVSGSACQTVLCTWECDPGVVVGLDAVVYGYCGC
jgi:hypothetical protein